MRVKVGLAQMYPKLGDVKANLQKHLDTIQQASQQGVELIIFPELSMTGYQVQDLVLGNGWIYSVLKQSTDILSLPLSTGTPTLLSNTNSSSQALYARLTPGGNSIYLSGNYGVKLTSTRLLPVPTRGDRVGEQERVRPA